MADHDFLMDGEDIKFLTKPTLGRPVVATLICVPLVIFCTPGHYWVALALLVAMFISWGEYYASEIIVTNRRVVAKIGLLQRTSVDMLLSKIESVKYVNTLSQQSTVIIAGSGGTHEVFKQIRKPKELRKHIQIQIVALQTTK